MSQYFRQANALAKALQELGVTTFALVLTDPLLAIDITADAILHSAALAAGPLLLCAGSLYGVQNKLSLESL